MMTVASARGWLSRPAGGPILLACSHENAAPMVIGVSRGRNMGVSMTGSDRILVEVSFPYIPQDCSLCETHLATSLACCTHLRKKHGFNKIILICVNCGISHKRRHSMECHAAKCVIAPKMVSKGNFACLQRNKVCKSQRGLSLHKRATHRMEFLAQQTEAHRRVAPKRRIWTQEEVGVLTKLKQGKGGTSMCASHGTYKKPN